MMGFGEFGACWLERKKPKTTGGETQLLRCCFYQGVENARIRELLQSGALLIIHNERELSLEARP